jgi:multidrug efflux pump subunit AcrA (membrane-fusion protein)
MDTPSPGKRWLWFVVAGILGCGLLAAGLFAWRGKSFFAGAEVGKLLAHPSDSPGERNRPAVRTVRPAKQPSLVVSVQELATVEAFFQADLRARTAGQVKSIFKDIHNTVAKGELLLSIDAPELQADVDRKAAGVTQREKEVLLAEQKAEIAKAAVDVAFETIALKQTAVSMAEHTANLRKIHLERWEKLAKKGQDVVSDAVVDEARRDYLIAQADCARTEADVRKAKAEWREMQATSAAALVDIQLKKVMVEVARRERDYAQELADLTRITAPFDGTIIKRNVDPGSFVPNSTTGNSEPLITLARTDIMTVSMKVPDNYAPYVSVNTEAILQLDELPGILLHGKVTRYSPSIDLKDRTMLVEVDLFNGTEAEYERFVSEGVAAFLAPFGPQAPGPAMVSAAAGLQGWSRNRKGIDDPLPVVPRISGQTHGDQPQRLLPGMSGQMRLLLRRLSDVYLLPSSAVFSRGGKQYIAQVVDAKVHLLPVRVQIDDGSWVKVAVITSKKGDLAEELSDLTGNEEIVTGGQGELEEGQAVNASLDN